MARRLPDFLEAYLQYTKNSESPLSYHLWSGIGVISASLERRVCMRWGHTEVYPNQYICLVGPSGARKAEPIRIARDFLKEVGVNLVAEKITQEALIRRLRESIGQYEDGSIKTQCAMSVVVEEFAVFLGEGNTNFMANLTDWYDGGHPTWEYDTKHSGTDEIVGACLNIIASMAPDWIPLSIPQAAIGGGFTSRIMWVVEHRKGKTIEDPNIYGVDDKLKTDLLADLEAIKKIAGAMEFERDALEMYKGWYVREEEKIAAGRPAIRDPRFSGYVSRRQTHIKKVCMAISASRSDDRRITGKDFERARLFMEKAERSMESVFGKVGRAIHVVQTQEVMEYIKARKTCSRQQLMQAFYRDIDARTLEIIESTMLATGMVKKKLSEGEQKDLEYTWVG